MKIKNFVLNNVEFEMPNRNQIENGDEAVGFTEFGAPSRGLGCSVHL